jgi:hypothetical protein
VVAAIDTITVPKKTPKTNPAPMVKTEAGKKSTVAKM